MECSEFDANVLNQEQDVNENWKNAHDWMGEMRLYGETWIEDSTSFKSLLGAISKNWELHIKNEHNDAVSHAEGVGSTAVVSSQSNL